MEKLKHKIEAVLFSAGKKVGVDEIAKLANTSTAMANDALMQLKEEYKTRESSLILVDEGTSWKLIVKDEFLPVVKKIVTETELSKSIMETLAVIAFKYPIKQSDLISIRTNKAYDHLKELEEMGYISRQKYGRSKLIKLTQKFFEYFDLHEQDLKDKFKDFKSIANAIQGKEQEIERLKAEAMERAKEEKEKEKQVEEGNLDLDDEETRIEAKEENSESREKLGELEVIDDDKESNTNNVDLDNDSKNDDNANTEKLGDLEVVDEPSEEEIEKENERIKKLKEADQKKRELEQKKAEEDKKESEHKKIIEERKKRGESFGIELSPEQEKEAEMMADTIINPKKTPIDKKEEESDEPETKEENIETAEADQEKAGITDKEEEKI